MRQNRPTLLHDFIAQQICLGNFQISIGKKSPNKYGFQRYRQRPGSLTLEFSGINSLSLKLKKLVICYSLEPCART